MQSQSHFNIYLPFIELILNKSNDINLTSSNHQKCVFQITRNHADEIYHSPPAINTSFLFLSLNSMLYHCLSIQHSLNLISSNRQKCFKKIMQNHVGDI